MTSSQAELSPQNTKSEVRSLNYEMAFSITIGSRTGGLLNLEAVMSHEVVQSGPTYPEQLCRLRYIAFGARKGARYLTAFGLFPGLNQIENIRDLSRVGEIEISRHDTNFLGHDHGAFHPVFQLADIAGPFMFKDHRATFQLFPLRAATRRIRSSTVCSFPSVA